MVRETQDVCRFWIYKERSSEGDSNEKQTTIDSMDLLYCRSKHPIGLLAVIPESQDEVNFLQTLKTGDMVVRDCKDDYPRLACPARSCPSLRVFEQMNGSVLV